MLGMVLNQKLCLLFWLHGFIQTPYSSFQRLGPTSRPPGSGKRLKEALQVQGAGSCPTTANPITLRSRFSAASPGAQRGPSRALLCTDAGGSRVPQLTASPVHPPPPSAEAPY